MPFLELPGAKIHYRERGAGERTIVFAHGLLWDGRLFAPQIDALADRYRCIAFDFRGQGRSQITREGYDMDTLAGDAAALIETLDAAPCHFVGLSMGGFIGLRLAIRHPRLLSSLILIETSAEPEPAENQPRYRRLNMVARWLGLRPVAGPVMQILFGRTFLADPEREAERRELRRRLIANRRRGITRAVEGVIERQGVESEIERIDLPTLIVVGEEDVATVPAKAERMHEKIPGSRLVRIPEAGHTSNLENPAAVNAAIEGFLAELDGATTG